MVHPDRRQFLGGTTALALGGSLLPALASAQATVPPAKFQLGLVSYNVAVNWDLATVLRLGQAAGFAAFEARTTHQHGIEPRLTAEQRSAIRERFAGSTMRFLSCGTVCEFHSPSPEVVANNIAECRKFCELVRDLGGQGVKVRPNGVAKGQTVPQACEQIGKALRECGKIAADCGVEIWLEVHGAVTQNPPNIRTMMQVCDHPAVGVCWNSNGTDLIDGSIGPAFEMLQPYLKHCHINDLSSKYPYRDLFRRLAVAGYDRYTLCEVGQVIPPEKGEEFLKSYRATWEKLVAG